MFVFGLVVFVVDSLTTWCLFHSWFDDFGFCSWFLVYLVVGFIGFSCVVLLIVFVCFGLVRLFCFVLSCLRCLCFGLILGLVVVVWLFCVLRSVCLLQLFVAGQFCFCVVPVSSFGFIGFLFCGFLSSVCLDLVFAGYFGPSGLVCLFCLFGLRVCDDVFWYVVV